MSIFLTEISTRHALLTKSKTFREKGKVVGNTSTLVDHEAVVIRGESDDEEDEARLENIPGAVSDGPDAGEAVRTRKGMGTRLKAAGPAEDDKKELNFQTAYEGFSIWGWVLCLLVDRKAGPGNRTVGADAQALMAEWITSTQQRADDNA